MHGPRERGPFPRLIHRALPGLPGNSGADVRAGPGVVNVGKMRDTSAEPGSGAREKMRSSPMPYPALPKAFSRLAVLALPFATVLMLSTGAASAQDAAPAEAPAAEAPAQPQPGDVVATVGGHEITEADLAFAAED